jgi:hypothetical protein
MQESSDVPDQVDCRPNTQDSNSCPKSRKLKSNCTRIYSLILLRHLRTSLRSTTVSAVLSLHVNQDPRAQRNATESPLLRLPREIRSIIWTYAVQVDLVRIQSKRQGPQRVTGCAVALNAGRTHITGDRQRSAFHLPEVCRQVYAETATLAYSTNTFLLSPSGSGWIRTLSLTQRRAITRVELSSYLPEYLAGYQLRSFGGVPKLCVLQGSGMASLRSKGLVGVTHCAVSIEAQELIKTDPFLRFHEDRKSWVRFITTVVQRIEGQHMVVEVQ